MSQCNFCTFRNMKRRAKQEGKRLVKKRDAFHVWGNGVAIYKLAPGEAIVNTEESPQCIAWFAELTDHCVC